MMRVVRRMPDVLRVVRTIATPRAWSRRAMPTHGNDTTIIDRRERSAAADFNGRQFLMQTPGNTMQRQIIQTAEAPKAIGTYSQAVRVGDTVYVSGQIPLDPASGQLRQRRHRGRDPPRVR